MILNRQRRVRVPLKMLEEFSARARTQLRLPNESLTICLVTDAQIARWNRAYRGKPNSTDVLSFPVNARSQTIRNGRGNRGNARHAAEKSVAAHSRSFNSGSHDYLGDIAIAPAVARRNARRFGRTFVDEMRILILHGMLHLMGYDHETDSGQMDRRERAARRALGLIR
jgi:probable rRNA maturation factor